MRSKDSCLNRSTRQARPHTEMLDAVARLPRDAKTNTNTKKERGRSPLELFLRLLAFLLQLVNAQHLVHLHVQPRPGFACSLVRPCFR